MRLEAMSRQGQRTDLTSDPVGPKSGERSNQELSDTVGDSATQIKRYIRLTALEPGILEKVDEGQIAMRPAVELSYLKTSEQESLMDAMEMTDATPSHAQAIKMRNLAGGQTYARGNRVHHDRGKAKPKDQFSMAAERLWKWIPKSVLRSRPKNTSQRRWNSITAIRKCRDFREQEYER